MSRRENFLSLVPVVVGAVALAWILGLVGGWPLPVMVYAILIMVMVHEFGHFLTAKRAGMLVTDFFVGFGPVLWSITVGETRYGVRALPFGGYVKVPGMTSADVVDPAIESRTYRAKSYSRRVLFASAGSATHLVMAFVLAWSSLAFIGQPASDHVLVSSLSHFDGVGASPAARAGLQPGDRIVAVDGVRVTSPNVLIARVSHGLTTGHVRLTIERAGHQRVVRSQVLDGCHLRSGGQRLESKCGVRGFVGVGLTAAVVAQNPVSAVGGAASLVGDNLVAAVKGVGRIFAPSQFVSLFHQVTSSREATNHTNQIQRPESLVGVVRLAVQGTRADGVRVMLNLLVTVNIFVGLVNILPLLPLDGGYVAVATYERLRSRKGQAPYRADVSRLNPLILAFVLVLLALFASTLYLDIAHPISNPFQ
jgi:membrane-associated protease RseP (regulator of RpoE activity)